MTSESPEQQLAAFMARYRPEVARVALAARGKLRRLLPGALELVYDNDNALVIGFGPSERASEAVLSIAVYPQWVRLFFLQGAGLPDPSGLLRGSGSRVRSILVDQASLLDSAAVRQLIKVAVARSPVAIEPTRRRRLLIKSVSARQRPRRPATGERR